jgi:hypothetical protein
MFACMYIYTFTASVIYLLFCWQSCSGIVEGTAGHIAVVVEDHGASSSLPGPSTGDNLEQTRVLRVCIVTDILHHYT